MNDDKAIKLLASRICLQMVEDMTAPVCKINNDKYDELRQDFFDCAKYWFIVAEAEDIGKLAEEVFQKCTTLKEARAFMHKKYNYNCELTRMSDTTKKLLEMFENPETLKKKDAQIAKELNVSTATISRFRQTYIGGKKWKTKKDY